MGRLIVGRVNGNRLVIGQIYIQIMLDRQISELIITFRSYWEVV